MTIQGIAISRYFATPAASVGFGRARGGVIAHPSFATIDDGSVLPLAFKDKPFQSGGRWTER